MAESEVEERQAGAGLNYWLLIFGAGWITFILSIYVPERSQMAFFIVGAALMFASVLGLIKKW
ncbi:MAG: hypothetical protein NDF55_05210 [archaeon GB-1867-005]|nr:hypothetical protein [Candidatus Culexmicrobium cathedralense]